MAYTITDTNDFEITITSPNRTYVLWKPNIKFGDIDGDVLPVYWHNKAQTTSSFRLFLDYNDVSSPTVVSAADLQVKMEEMIKNNGSTGGGGSSAGQFTFLLMGG